MHAPASQDAIAASSLLQLIWLASPALPGFVVGYSASNQHLSIVEEDPEGETVRIWTRMVTTQSFAGLAARKTPADYARNIAANVPNACPGATVSPMTASPRTKASRSGLMTSALTVSIPWLNPG